MLDVRNIVSVVGSAIGLVLTILGVHYYYVEGAAQISHACSTIGTMVIFVSCCFMVPAAPIFHLFKILLMGFTGILFFIFILKG